MATEASTAEVRGSRRSVVAPCYNEDAVLLAANVELAAQLARIPELESCVCRGTSGKRWPSLLTQQRRPPGAGFDG